MLLLACCWAFPYLVSAQNALPDTDIFICDVEFKKGKYSFKNLKNITNRTGYDNQPQFIDNQTILYTSIREDGQADIYQINLTTGKITQVTSTPEDEYSPTLMPDGKHISTVRVEADSTQRLWKFPLGKPDSFSLVLPDVKGVGYHEWINDSMLALFMLGNPFTLQLANTNSKLQPAVLDSFIGRSIQCNKNGTLFYVSKRDSDVWCIKSRYFGSEKTDLSVLDYYERIGSSVFFCGYQVEDFFYTSDNALWFGNKSKLIRIYLKPKNKQEENHLEVFDFKGTPAENFYRIAISPDGKKLALVSYVGKKP